MNWLTRLIAQLRYCSAGFYTLLVCATLLAGSCGGCFSASGGDTGAPGQPRQRHPGLIMSGSEVVARWQASAKWLEVRDPVYDARKKFNAISLAGLVASAGYTNLDFEILVRCLDGYLARLPSSEALDGTGYLAIGDETSANGVGFAPLKTKSGMVDPGPLYLFWTDDRGNRPRPYQIKELEFCPSNDSLARAQPSSATLARQGYELFKKNCSSCHAVNGAGGRVAVDLNVPMNVTEYWKEPALKRLLFDPATIRANARMPALHLSESDAEKVIAYLKDMRKRKLAN